MATTAARRNVKAHPERRASRANLGFVAIAAVAALAVALYARGFGVSLVGDDYKLLDAALRAPFLDLLSGKLGILGYYRPVSRELYFYVWGRLFHEHALGYHVVNAITYAGVVAMFFAFVRREFSERIAIASSLVFVLFPPTGALLSWVSCAQDLIALFWGVATLLLYRSGRTWLAGLTTALAILSKETAVILPFALVALEWLAPRVHGLARDMASEKDATPPAPATPRARLIRLAPAFLGLAVAVTIAIAVRRTWPAGTSVAVWSPRQMIGAWRLPADFVRTLWPPDTFTGIAAAARQTPWLLAIVAVLAAFAIPLSAKKRKAQHQSNEASRKRERPQSGARHAAGVQAVRDESPGDSPSTSPARVSRIHLQPEHVRAIVFGLVLLILGMIPVGAIIERWRGYFFSFAALGSSIAIAALLLAIPSWPARAIVALAAIVSLGANGYYRPVEAAWAPARHPHVNYAFFKSTAELSDQLMSSLTPLCDSLRAVPRTFTLGVPREIAFETALGPAFRVMCRDTVTRVRAMEEIRPEDVRSSFAVLRFDPQTTRFAFERAGADLRTRIGEGFTISGRYDIAAACYETAVAEQPWNAELRYPFTVAIAAAGRLEDAHNAWRETVARGFVLSPEGLANQVLPRGAGAVSDSLRRAVVALTSAVMRDPTDAAAHRAFSRELLVLGRIRAATLEQSAAYAIGRRNEDLVTLAECYEGMAAPAEALDAYRRALAGTLDPATRALALKRLEYLQATNR